MASLGASAYLDVATYLRAPAAQETASLLGLSTSLAGASQPAGTTTLAVTSSSGWAAGPLWVLDGPYSEVVSVTGAGDGTHLTLAAPGTQFAHAYATCAQAGTAGSLAESILRASSWVESICQQGTQGGDRSLYAVARTETWPMPTGRAYIDRDQVVVVRPGHFPVQTVTTLQIQFGQGQTLSLDVSQDELASPGRTIEVPYLLAGQPNAGVQLFLESRGLSRARRQWAQVTYTGGIPVGSVPYDIQQACALLVSEILSQRQNPTGASEMILGKRTVVQRQRGDLIGDSLLLLRARDLLEPWREEVWSA
jgi:hypothetical protein